MGHHPTHAAVVAVLLLAVTPAGAATIAQARFAEVTSQTGLAPLLSQSRPGDRVTAGSRSTIPTAAATPNEIGFSTVVTNTRTAGAFAPSTSNRDTDHIGVIDRNGSGDRYSFVYEDTDGLLTTTFDTADLAGFSDVAVSVDYALDMSGGAFNSSDFVAIEVVLGGVGGPPIELLRLDARPEFSGVAGNVYRTASATLPAGATSATVRLLVDTDDEGSFVYFDNVLITGDPIAVPEPLAAGSVAAVGALALSRRRARQPVCQAGDQ